VLKLVSGLMMLGLGVVLLAVTVSLAALVAFLARRAQS